MPAAYDLLASKKRVNVLKKVKVQGIWKLCPAVVEANGKLRDRVKVNGHVEVHPEGVYFLEWRDNGKRVRESVRDKADVLRLARLKAFEPGPEEAPDKSTPVRAMELATTSGTSAAAEITEALSLNRAPAVPVAQVIFQAIESYIQKAVHRAIASQARATALQVCPEPEQHQAQPQPSNGDQFEIPQPQVAHGTHW